MQETQVRSLDQEDPLEKGMATHCSSLIWEIPWTEEPGGLQSMGSKRVGQDVAIKLQLLLLTIGVLQGCQAHLFWESALLSPFWAQDSGHPDQSSLPIIWQHIWAHQGPIHLSLLYPIGPCVPWWFSCSELPTQQAPSFHSVLPSHSDTDLPQTWSRTNLSSAVSLPFLYWSQISLSRTMPKRREVVIWYHQNDAVCRGGCQKSVRVPLGDSGTRVTAVKIIWMLFMEQHLLNPSPWSGKELDATWQLNKNNKSTRHQSSALWGLSEHFSWAFPISKPVILLKQIYPKL